MAEVARGRGLRVVTAEHELPDEVDVVFAQESATSLLLAERYPHTPQAYSFIRTSQTSGCLPRSRKRSLRSSSSTSGWRGEPGRSPCSRRSFACASRSIRSVSRRAGRCGPRARASSSSATTSPDPAWSSWRARAGRSTTNAPRSASGARTSRPRPKPRSEAATSWSARRARSSRRWRAAGRPMSTTTTAAMAGSRPRVTRASRRTILEGRRRGPRSLTSALSRIWLLTTPRWGRRTATSRSPTTALPSTHRSSCPSFSALHLAGNRSLPRSARWPGS